MLASILPSSVIEVLSIPPRWGRLRSALSPGAARVAALRALMALSLFVGFAMFLVRRDARILEEPVVEP